jgi:hypothetical protein
MKYIPNRNNKITDFKIGDIVSYNPNITNLPDPKDRPRDIGKIYQIDLIKKYIYIKRNNNLDGISGGICVEAIDHYPQKLRIIITI